MHWNEYKDWNKILPLISGFSFELFSEKGEEEEEEGDRELFFKSAKSQDFDKNAVLAIVNSMRNYSLIPTLNSFVKSYKDSYYGMSPRDQSDYSNRYFKKRYEHLTEIRKGLDLDKYQKKHPFKILSEETNLVHSFGIPLPHIGYRKENVTTYQYDNPDNAERVKVYSDLIKAIDNFILFFKDVLKIIDPTPYINCNITPSNLYKELLKLKFKSIDKQTQASEFNVCLSKKRGKSKINWIGQQNHFYYIIKQLKSKDIIDFEGGNQWYCIAETFSFKGTDLTPNEFKGFNKKVTKDFEKAINYMITRLAPKVLPN